MVNVLNKCCKLTESLRNFNKVVGKTQHFIHEIAPMVMAKTDGEILKELIAELEITVTSFARKLGKDRATIYAWMEDKNKKGIGMDNWMLIGEKLKIDIFEKIPALKKYKPNKEENYSGKVDAGRVADLEEKYNVQQKDVDFLKSKLSHYTELIETKNELIDAMKARIEEKDAIIRDLKKQIKQ